MRIHRRKKKLSQKKLAKLLQISQSYISQLENNNRYKLNPRIKFILRLCKKLDMCPLKLIIHSADCCAECQLNCPFNLKKEK